MIKGKGLRLVVVDLPTSHQLTEGNGIDAEIMRVINDMLIELMQTMARLEQEKRVERIKQGLDRKKARGEKVGGKARNQEAWDKVAGLLKRGGLKIDEIAKLAGVGVATVYRVKKELAST